MAPAGVEALAAFLGLSASDPTDSFFDLGSGMGRLVMHMAMKHYARLATGVEQNSARHSFATSLADTALPTSMPRVAGDVGSEAEPLRAGVQLLHGDMLRASIATATVLFTNPACFSCEVKQALVDKILNECHRLKFVVTTTPPPRLVSSGEYTEWATATLPPMIGYSWWVPVTIYRQNGQVVAEAEAAPAAAPAKQQSLRR